MTKKLFVLDTNVLLHDPQSLFRFDEHDIYIPLITLEEMDAHKVGMTDVARNARQASRYIDELFSKEPDSLTSGIPLNLAGHKEARGKLILQTSVETASLPDSLLGEKADNLILGLVKYLQQQKNGYEHVALVSKDINIRIKARALGLHAEDYFNDKVLEDSDVLYTGYRQLDGEFWLRNGSELQSWQEQGSVFYRIQGDDALQMQPNELLLDEDGEKTLQARVKEVNRAEKFAVLQTVKDYTHPKNSVFGITARNWGQNYALNLLMDPEIDLVTLLGQAGTGKTLLTLASALTQVLDQQRYSEIIMTRVTVPLGNDIGFLPEMLDKAVMGADVVFANNQQKPRQSLAYRAAYAVFNFLYKSFNGIHLAKEAPLYRLLSKRVVNFILQHPQPAVTYRHLPATGGFARINMEYSSKPLAKNTKKLGESIDRGMRLLVSTTQAPMRLVTSLSLFGAAANLVYSVYVVAVGIFKADVAPGWVSMSLQQSGMFFLISLVLLVLGEYILHMASLSNEGPLYHVGQEFTSARMTRREKLNIEDASYSATHDLPNSDQVVA